MILKKKKIFNALAAALRGVINPVIVDVGAHWGEEDPVFEHLAQGGFTHIMVEPDPKNCKIIEEDHLSKKGRKLIRGAVSDSRGMKLFWFSHSSSSGHRPCGSLLEPTGQLFADFPNVSFSGPELVQCLTLDEIYEQEGLAKVDLLWVDIQGGEMHMIRGGRHALTCTKFLFMETDRKEYYHGQSLKPELLSELSGWKILEDLGGIVLMENVGIVQ
jgi:FkbM family methyltransferase